MSLVDVGIILVTAVAMLIGWRFRAISLFFLLLAVVLGIVAARYLAPEMLGSFQNLSPRAGQILAWLVPFTITLVLVLIVGAIVSSWFEAVQLKWLDHALGALLGGMVVLVLITTGLTHLASRNAARPAWLRDSVLVTPIFRWTRPMIEEGKNLVPELGKPAAP